MEPNDFAGSIGMFGGNFAPKGTALCDGRLLPIAGNNILFMTIGIWYGGDGRNTLGLPDLRGRCAMGFGDATGMPGIKLGEFIGRESGTVELKVPEHHHTASFQLADLNLCVSSSIDEHSVTMHGSLACNISSGGQHSPKGNFPGVETTTAENLFTPTAGVETMAANRVIDPSVMGVVLETSFVSTQIPCTVQASTGATNPVTATTLPPVQGVNYCINVSGNLPPHT